MALDLRRVFIGFTLMASAAAAALSGGCSSLPPANGPTVGVRNDSDAPLRATFWVGDRDEQRPGQPANMTAQETLEIPPYGTKQFRLSAFSGYDSPTRSFVRVQIQPVGASFQPTSQHWFELNPPSPYTVRVYGVTPNLRFDRVGGGSMVAVPSDLWFRNATAGMNTSGAGSVRVYGANRGQPANGKGLNSPAAMSVSGGATTKPATVTTTANRATTTTTATGRVVTGTPRTPTAKNQFNQPATPVANVPTDRGSGND
jgi:hypothetical protein